MKHLLIIIYTLFSFVCSGQKNSSLIAETSKFEFHSDLWINLHHFLYQKAKGSQLKHLQEDGNVFLNINEDENFKSLNHNERLILETSIDYYKEHIIEKSLLRNLANLRVWLQDQHGNKKISDTTYSKKYTTILNDFSSIYKKRFWRNHDKHNRKILNKHLKLLEELEPFMFERLKYFAGFNWPESKIRIDLTTYANYAGAYSQTRPNFNAVISTLDPFSEQSTFVEIVFHEAAHGLFWRKSKFRSKIFQLSNEMSIPIPKNLWHASQFYLCGKLVQEELKKKGIKHELIMDIKNIFSSYNNSNFRSILDKFYNNQINHEATARKLLNNLKKK